ncbi:aldo/keto reductase [Candidatus Sumerlaeota bacterium]|nr:aldo/keto reductase [Candidatus Sumerlaeota bacterium]
MQLRAFGKRSGQEVLPLSIGGMRLPRDVDLAVSIVREAIDQGLRYIDTSRGYGESEWVIGLALQDGYRDKVILSSKWSPWITKISQSDDASADCVRRRIDETMRRLNVDFLDYYQVWNIHNRELYDQAVARGGMVEGILKAKDEGLVGHLGFTTHDSVENLLTYIEEVDWCEILLTSYNLLNTTYDPVIKAAHAKGIGTVVMNPVGGGKLAEQSPVLMDLAQRTGAVSVPDLAVRFVLSNPCIDTMLIGMTKASDITDSIASVERGAFSANQLEAIDLFLKDIRERAAVFCTSCKYCMPCPHGVDIPAVMSSIADLRFWGWADRARSNYEKIKGKADLCIQCEACLPQCTQHLMITEEMAFAADTFGK